MIEQMIQYAGAFEAHVLFLIVMICVVLDITTGLSGAIVQQNVNSTVMRQGLTVQFLVLSSAGFLAGIDIFVDVEPDIFHLTLVVMVVFVVINYAISLAENLGKMGMKLPSVVVRNLEKLEDELED